MSVPPLQNDTPPILPAFPVARFFRQSLIFRAGRGMPCGAFREIPGYYGGKSVMSSFAPDPPCRSGETKRLESSRR